MPLPLPRVVSDVGPGGGIVTARRGINALRESDIENKIKGIEAQYKPLTLKAQAMSQMAYANLMGPQFFAKMMGNPDIAASLSEPQIKAGLDLLYKAGTGQGTGNNFINNTSSPSSASSVNKNKLLQLVTGGWNSLFDNPQTSQGSNIFSNTALPQQNTNQSPQAQQPIYQPSRNTTRGSGVLMRDDGSFPTLPPRETDNPNIGFDKNNEPYFKDENKGGTYAENAAHFQDIKEGGKGLGKARAEAIQDVGKQQMDLSTSGVILDRLVGITQNPEFQKMRSEIPYFQDKQLWYLSKNGTKYQQDMIGDLISTAEAFKASTVNSFKGKALEKEFNLADKIKIDENDTMGVIQGKLRSLKTLKQIAESKNDIILGLMTNKHMNLGEATKIANKMVDISGIEKDVDRVLNPQPAEHDIQYMMKKRNLPRNEIIKQLKNKGYKLEIQLQGEK